MEKRITKIDKIILKRIITRKYFLPLKSVYHLSLSSIVNKIIINSIPKLVSISSWFSYTLK